jgi:hypothetical protein
MINGGSVLQVFRIPGITDYASFLQFSSLIPVELGTYNYVGIRK